MRPAGNGGPQSLPAGRAYVLPGGLEADRQGGVCVARGTKLYQQPGSPLIQGHSKTERSALREWVKGVAAGAVGSGFLFAGYALLVPGTTLAIMGTTLEGVVAGLLGGALVSLPSAVPAAGIGVWLARRMGWRRQWLPAIALTPLTLAVLVAFLSNEVVLGGLSLG